MRVHTCDIGFPGHPKCSARFGLLGCCHGDKAQQQQKREQSWANSASCHDVLSMAFGVTPRLGLYLLHHRFPSA
jgi:hypothetical protein